MHTKEVPPCMLISLYICLAKLGGGRGGGEGRWAGVKGWWVLRERVEYNQRLSHCFSTCSSTRALVMTVSFIDSYSTHPKNYNKAIGNN